MSGRPGGFVRLRVRMVAFWHAHRPCYVELLSGGIALAWVTNVALVSGPLAARPGYTNLPEVAPDWMWLALGGTGGALQMAAAIYYTSRPRRIVAAAMAGFWFLVTDGIRGSAPLSPSWVFPAGLVIANLTAIAWRPKRALP